MQVYLNCYNLALTKYSPVRACVRMCYFRSHFPVDAFTGATVFSVRVINQVFTVILLNPGALVILAVDYSTVRLFFRARNSTVIRRCHLRSVVPATVTFGGNVAEFHKSLCK